jgi:hypothetical protein
VSDVARGPLVCYDQLAFKDRQDVTQWLINFCDILLIVYFFPQKSEGTFTILFQSYIFLAHLSWKLKQVFLIARCLSVCKLLHFCLLLQNHWANFKQAWHKLSFRGGDSKLFKWRSPSSRGDNSKRVKIHWNFFFKSSSPEPTGQFQSNLVSTNHKNSKLFK